MLQVKYPCVTACSVREVTVFLCSKSCVRVKTKVFTMATKAHVTRGSCFLSDPVSDPSPYPLFSGYSGLFGVLHVTSSCCSSLCLNTFLGTGSGLSIHMAHSLTSFQVCQKVNFSVMPALNTPSI